MKEYKKPIVEEEALELEDIIATSGKGVSLSSDWDGEGDKFDWNF